MRKIKKFLFIILFIYLLANIYLFLNQKNMLYFPNKTDFYSCDNFIEEQKKEFNNTRFYEVK
jgi:hypothetical protein